NSKIGFSNSRTFNVNQKKVVGGVDVTVREQSSRQTTADKMKLKDLMMQAQNDDLKSNPIAARRLQQRIAQKAECLYGVDRKKMMGSVHAVSAENYGMKLSDKVNGRK
ncbi:MAG: hypothetical protein Q4G02_01620, partial [bacterium]|nr:hypothetical protein [bacterium]